MGLNLVALLTSPLRVAKKLLANLLQLTDSSYALALPVAGLDEEAAHQILSTLRAAQHSEGEAEMPGQWLAALQLAQIASDRLVWDLSRVEESLEFWSERLRQGQHLRTMLFGQGPVSFSKDVARLVSRHKSSQSPSDRIERRVIVLRDLRAKLAESLAEVHAAASLLHLKAAKSQESGEDFDPDLLHKIARQAIEDCCFSTAKAYSDVRSYSHRKLKGLESMNMDLRQTALAQMLRLHSKKMFHFGSSGSALDLARLNGDSAVSHKGSLDKQDEQRPDFDGYLFPAEFLSTTSACK